MKLEYFTVLNLFSEYMKNRNYSEATQRQYVFNTKHFFKWFKKDDLRDTGKADIYSYREYLETLSYSDNTKRGFVKSLSLLFKYLSRNEYILANPFDGLELTPQKKYKGRESLPEDDMNKFLDSIKAKGRLGLRDRTICELLYGTGLRISELTGLKARELDLSSGRALVHGKNRKDRIVPLGSNVVYWLKRYLSRGRGFFLKKVFDNNVKENLFISIRGTMLSNTVVRRMLKMRFKESGSNIPLSKVSPHVIRHTFATHILENGAGIKHVKEILGHESIETTVIYTHFNGKSLKRILKMYHPRENELYEEVNEEEIMKIFDK